MTEPDAITEAEKERHDALRERLMGLAEAAGGHRETPGG